jgi:hypothetical protein
MKEAVRALLFFEEFCQRQVQEKGPGADCRGCDRKQPECKGCPVAATERETVGRYPKKLLTDARGCLSASRQYKNPKKFPKYWTVRHSELVLVVKVTEYEFKEEKEYSDMLQLKARIKQTGR